MRRYVCVIGVVLIILFFFVINGLYASSLSVELVDMDTGTAAAGGITFDNYTDASESSPWVLADQYMHIEFDCDYSGWYWGLRIITNNMSDIAVDSDGDGTVDDQPSGVEDISGNMFYGGVIKVELDESGNIAGVTDTASDKITLCWQVYDEVDSSLIAGVAPPAVSDSDGDGIYEDDNVSTEWYTGDWAYIGDKSDDVSSGDAVLWEDDDGSWVLNYCAAAYGCGSIIRSLAPHPDDGDIGITDDDLIDEDGDGDVYNDGWDIYVFVAGRFWNTGYFDMDGDGTYTETYYQLPAGDYKTTLYIEIFYE